MLRSSGRYVGEDARLAWTLRWRGRSVRGDALFEGTLCSSGRFVGADAVSYPRERGPRQRSVRANGASAGTEHPKGWGILITMLFAVTAVFVVMVVLASDIDFSNSLRTLVTSIAFNWHVRAVARLGALTVSVPLFLEAVARILVWQKVSGIISLHKFCCARLDVRARVYLPRVHRSLRVASLLSDSSKRTVAW